MRLLRVIANMNPATGGPCEGIRNSIAALQKLGVENEVVSLDNPAAPFLEKDTFTVHALGLGKGPWSYHPKLIPWLLANFHRFDAVVIHGLWLYPSYAVFKALKTYRKTITANRSSKVTPRMYVMPHGMLDPYFQKASGRKLKALRNWVYWKLIEGKVINSADASLFTCEEELLLARQAFDFYRPKKEVNVGYGIAKPPICSSSVINAFHEKCPEVKDSPYILFLGRLHPKKGVDILIKAYSLLLKERGHKSMPQLIIAGPGMETAYGQTLRKMATESRQLQSKIFFPGMLISEVKWGAFYGCDAFVLPSHQENFGIAVVEALACCKPVLISNKVNIWREIETGGGGIVNNDSLEGTTMLLKKWLDLEAKQKETMKKNAFALFQEHFEAQRVAQRFYDTVTCRATCIS